MCSRSDSNVPHILLTFLCGSFFVGTGFAWFNDQTMYRNYPTTTLSIVLAIVSAIALLWVLLNRIVFLSYRYNIVGLQKYHQSVTRLYDTSYGQWPDNIAIVSAALSTGFYLINIVSKIVSYNSQIHFFIHQSNHLPTLTLFRNTK